MESLFAHSMHGPSAFFGYGMFLLAIPVAFMIVKRSRARDRANAISAQLGAEKYKAHLEAQGSKSAAQSPSNGPSHSNGTVPSNGVATPPLANSLPASSQVESANQP